MVKRSLSYYINFTNTVALGIPATSPHKGIQGKLSFYFSGSYLRLIYFFRVYTVPNWRATCGPTPSKFINIPLQKDRTPYSAMVLLIACMQPVYQVPLETILILMFSKGIMVSTCPIPESQPQKISFATSPMLFTHSHSHLYNLIRYIVVDF